MSDENDNEVSYDEYGFNEFGIHQNGTAYDERGFDHAGNHRDTDTAFNPVGRTRDNSRYDADGYDYSGYDRDGYDIQGYDRDGYDRDGEDDCGNTRCDNGDCDDEFCERCHPNHDFELQLGSYSERAHITHGWRAKEGSDGPAYLYAGHEIEMYSDGVDYEDVEYVLRQLNTAYAKFNPLTRTGRCAIAKHDGSLDEGGFETVTVPLTDEQMYGIFTSFKVLGDGKCSAWDKGNDVGHHIHLSKRAITPLTLGKMLVFMNADANRTFLTQIAGRACSYSKFRTKKITDQQNADRYEVLNVTDRTVEFRLFKSNLYSRAILKNHEFAKAVVAFCDITSHGFGSVDNSDDPLHWVNFRAFVAARRHTYRFLHEFMLSHSELSIGYRNNAGLPSSVAKPKEGTPLFRMIRDGDATRNY